MSGGETDEYSGEVPERSGIRHFPDPFTALFTRHGQRGQTSRFDRHDCFLEDHVLVGGGAVCDTIARRDAPRAVVHALMNAIYGGGMAELAACSGAICWLAIWAGEGDAWRGGGRDQRGKPQLRGRVGEQQQRVS